MGPKRKGGAPLGYSCRECGYRSPKWLGRCPACSTWESLLEETVVERPRRGGRPALSPSEGEARPYLELGLEAATRAPCGIDELDRALGGGFVPGMVTLLGGEPGVGKSTLALQCAAAMADRGSGALYVSGEESGAQIRLRGERLGVRPERLYVLAGTDCDVIEREIERLSPVFAVIDSIQTMLAPEIPAPAGSVVQVRECAVRLLGLAKARSLPLLLVGHITKEGILAGPKVLEHIVDTVLTFEGDPQHLHRLLRCSKNRYGPADEVGMFAMTPGGLEQLDNPSQWFLRDRQAGAPGSAVTVVQEGSRPFLAEVQALAGRAAFGTPRRSSVGIDSARLALLVAVLERRARLALGEIDLFVNAAGGIRMQEPAADLAVACAVASALLQKPLPATAVLIGEIGLAGEVRSAPRLDGRLKEAARCGFNSAVVPARDAGAADAAGLRAVPVRGVEDALQSLFDLRSEPQRTRPASRPRSVEV
jgi:DNA repair protein RadA/Sms